MYSIRLCPKECVDDIDSEIEIEKVEEADTNTIGDIMCELSDRLVDERDDIANLCARSEDGHLVIYGPKFSWLREMKAQFAENNTEKEE